MRRQNSKIEAVVNYAINMLNDGLDALVLKYLKDAGVPCEVAVRVICHGARRTYA